MFIKTHLIKKDSVYLLGGDEVVVSKEGCVKDKSSKKSKTKKSKTKKKKGKRGRPKGSGNKDKKDIELSPSKICSKHHKCGTQTH
jgi:hypothetical protein